MHVVVDVVLFFQPISRTKMPVVYEVMMYSI